MEYGQFDHYEPHCDVTCERSGPKPGGRVATMLLVCEMPKLGGATAFPRHHDRALTLRPATGDAVFFAYDKNARSRSTPAVPCATASSASCRSSCATASTASSPASHFDVDGGAAVGVNAGGWRETFVVLCLA